MPFHEICFPRCGLWLRHLGRRALPVDANHVHLFHRGEVHRVSHPTGCGDRNTGILIAADVLAEISIAAPGSRDPEAPFGVTHFPVDAATYAHHGALLAAARGDAEPIVVEERALQLAAALVRKSRDVRPARAVLKSHRDLAEQARVLLAEQLDHPLQLTDLAAALGTSSFHLCRVLRKHVGTSIGQYRQQLRLRRALVWLTETSDALDLIAARTGFADRSHLSRAFAKAFGHSPTRFRRRLEHRAPV